MSDSSWLTSFPEMDRADLRTIRKTLDGAYKEFSREYGDLIEAIFDPLLSFLIWFEKLFMWQPDLSSLFFTILRRKQAFFSALDRARESCELKIHLLFLAYVFTARSRSCACKSVGKIS